MKQKVKNTIPVYDICSLSRGGSAQEDVIAEPFAPYLLKHPNLHFPHRHSFYHIVLFTEGAGFHTIDFERFAVSPGQIYFMVPGQVHSWSFEGGIDGYVINFPESFFQSFLADKHYLEQFRFFRGIAKDSVIQLPQKAFGEVADTIAKIVAETQTHGANGMDMLRARLLEVLITVSRENSMQTPHGAPQQNQLLLYNFRKLVDEYYAEKRLPKEYAAMLYITPNHLNALCNDLLGKAAGEVIRDRILLEAKRLLVNADNGIAEIAYQLNFTDNSHLTRFFKKHTGVSPEEFRRNLAGAVKNG